MPEDYIDQLIKNDIKENSEPEKKLTGVYLQNDVLQILNRLSKKGGRGAKSHIVNNALKNAFIEKGLL